MSCYPDVLSDFIYKSRYEDFPTAINVIPAALAIAEAEKIGSRDF